jgi:hypothetical protein
MAYRVLTVFACIMLVSLVAFVLMNVGGDRAPSSDVPRSSLPPRPTPSVSTASRPPASVTERNVVAKPVSPPELKPDAQPMPVQASEPATAESRSAGGSPEEKKGTDPPGATRALTWREVEAELDALRQERKKNPAAAHRLADYYDRLVEPSFTSSRDIPEHCTKLAMWRKELPESPTPLLVLGRAYLAYAWQARGSGFANTVTEEGWELFHVRIGEARRLLEQAAKAGPKDAEVHRQLIEVAKGQDLDEVQARAWLDEGRKVDPTYPFLYTAMAEYLLPRWHGEPGDVEKFANEIPSLISGDDGLEAMAMIAFVVSRYDGPIDSTLLYGEYDHRLLVQGAEVLATRYPQSRQHVHFAALCTLVAQDHAAARRIRPAVGELDEKDGVWPWRNSYAGYLSWCDAGQAPGGEETWLWGTPVGCTGLAFAGNPRFVWFGQQFGNAVYLMDSQTKRPRMRLPSPGGVMNHLAVDNKRKWVAGSFWRGPLEGVVLWDLAAEENSQLVPTEGRCNCLAIHPTLPVIVWADDKRVTSLNIETGEPEFGLVGGTAHRLMFSADGALLAVERGSQISIYDGRSGKLKWDLPHEGATPRPDAIPNQFLDFDDEGRVWTTATAASAEKTTYPVLRFSADGSLSEVIVPDVKSPRAQLSPDRRTLAVLLSPAESGQTGIDIWDLSKGSAVKHLAGHWQIVREARFSADGNKLATLGEPIEPIKIWSLADLPRD